MQVIVSGKGVWFAERRLDEECEVVDREGHCGWLVVGRVWAGLPDGHGKEGSWKRGATVEFSVATDPRINTDYIFRYHCYCYSYSIPSLRGRVECKGAGLWPRGQTLALHQNG